MADTTTTKTLVEAAHTNNGAVRRPGPWERFRKRVLGGGSFATAALDIVLYPLVWPAGLLLKNVRRAGFRRLPRCRNALLSIGVMPVSTHYYDPLIRAASLKRKLSDERDLPGIDWNVETQLALLDRFSYNDELRQFPQHEKDRLTYFYNNSFFESGDAEYWYNIVRTFKPRRIFEIGSGNSTLLAAAAIRKNAEEDPSRECTHVCIEPYENGWLEQLGIAVVREKVEDLDPAFFRELEANDILFIDSSHMIRPQGDVLFEYLQVLPTLAPGVIVHVHDIFTPRDYPEHWILDDVRFWNEQYLLEAFLTHNDDWEILGALNFLKHHHYPALKRSCPCLEPAREPASFYLRRR